MAGLLETLPITPAIAGIALLAAGCGDEDPAAGGDVPDAPRDAPWLVEITTDLGLTAQHVSGATGEMHMPEIMGSGLALFDADGDGALDLYLVNGNPNLPRTNAPPVVRNRLLLSEGGRFVDATEASGLGDPGYGMGVAVGDIDNDGDLDVYVTNWGPDALYRNNADGTFQDITAAAAIDGGGWSCSAAFLDFDRDGWLDIYVTRYVEWAPESRCYDRAGRLDYCSPDQPPQHDLLFRNRGDGTFQDVSGTAGMAAVFAPGLGVACADYDDDGWIDVYVTNDAYPNNLWINQRDGTFADGATVLGAAYNLHGQPEAGMGVLAADLDADLDLDLFMTHTTVESNTLYRNDGVTGFQDATGQSGLAANSMIFTGFGTVAFDIELDGDLDLAVVNGRVQRADPKPNSTSPAPWDRYAEPNLLYLNDGRGVFTLERTRGGAFTELIEVSRGLVEGDLDGDGDLDLAMTSIDAPLRVFRNDAPREGHWLIVRALESTLQRDGVGARVTIEAGGRSQTRAIGGGSSYLSARAPWAHFGLGSADAISTIEVHWNDGVRERFPGGAADRIVVVERGSGVAAP